MPGFPDKFMPFMSQPPGSLLSSAAVQTYRSFPLRRLGVERSN